jgi:hypothetical protein
MIDWLTRSRLDLKLQPNTGHSTVRLADPVTSKGHACTAPPVMMSVQPNLALWQRRPGGMPRKAAVKIMHHVGMYIKTL